MIRSTALFVHPGAAPGSAAPPDSPCRWAASSGAAIRRSRIPVLCDDPLVRRVDRHRQLVVGHRLRGTYPPMPEIRMPMCDSSSCSPTRLCPPAGSSRPVVSWPSVRRRDRSRPPTPVAIRPRRRALRRQRVASGQTLACALAPTTSPTCPAPIAIDVMSSERDVRADALRRRRRHQMIVARGQQQQRAGDAPEIDAPVARAAARRAPARCADTGSRRTPGRSRPRPGCCR